MLAFFAAIKPVLMLYKDGGLDHRLTFIPMGIHLLKVNNRNTRTRCEICSKLTIKTPE